MAELEADSLLTSILDLRIPGGVQRCQELRKGVVLLGLVSLRDYFHAADSSSDFGRFP